jgi:hypothetical protein
MRPSAPTILHLTHLLQLVKKRYCCLAHVATSMPHAIALAIQSPQQSFSPALLFVAVLVVAVAVRSWPRQKPVPTTDPTNSAAWLISTRHRHVSALEGNPSQGRRPDAASRPPCSLLSSGSKLVNGVVFDAD